MSLLTTSTRLDVMHKQFGAVDYTPTTEYRVAAVVAPPEDDSGSGLLEPESASYSRIVIPNTSDEFEIIPTRGVIANVNQWEFSQVSLDDWGTVLGIALFDDSDSYLGYAPFSTSRVLKKNYTLIIKTGSFMVSMDSSPISVYVEDITMPSIKTSPDNSRFIFSVSDAGASVWTATDSFGPPTAPTSLANVSGTLTWNASSGDGGTPITSYTVWKSDSSTLLKEFEILASDETSYDVPTGELGVFFVTAENSVGSSDPSNEVTIS